MKQIDILTPKELFEDPYSSFLTHFSLVMFNIRVTFMFQVTSRVGHPVLNNLKKELCEER